MFIKKKNGETRHELEAIKSRACVFGDSLIGFALLIGGPALNMVQNVDPRGVLGFDSLVLVFSEDGPVHCGEIDDGDGEGTVHVENDASQACFGERNLGHGSEFADGREGFSREEDK